MFFDICQSSSSSSSSLAASSNFTKLAELAREANEDKWESKVDKYVNDGLTEEEARLKVNQKLNGVELDQTSSPSSIIVCSSKRNFLDRL
jgi:hypothetical protein